MRAHDKRITFVRPFVLKGLVGVQPAGTYSVETGERSAEFVSLPGAKLTAIWIRIWKNFGTAGVLDLAKFDPLDLAAALIRDAIPAEGARTGVQNDDPD
jgi:hypothetical protein